MKWIEVKPQETNEVLVNPGMGWTTFHSFNGDEINKDYPKASIAYFRFYWDQLEPQEGKYRWDIIDKILQTARQKEQQLAFRIMTANGERHEETIVPTVKNFNMKVPEWFYNLGCKGIVYFDKGWKPGTPKCWQPDYSDPIYLEKHGNFISAFANRYDGHPDLAHVDIGSVGRWGEWHTSGTGINMPPFEIKKQIIDLYLEGFKKTPLLMLIADREGLLYAVSNGTGWRADCFGDMRPGQNLDDPCLGRNHMDFYPKRIKEVGIINAWKKVPVAFETCWVIKYWKEQNWDIAEIFRQGLDMHVSILNNKSSSIPEEWWPQVNGFSRRMGYRFVLKELSHSRVISGTAGISLSMVWENKGVAPCYYKYLLAFRLRNVHTGKEWVTPAKADLTGWLPGTNKVEEEIKPPADFPKGFAELGVGILDPCNNQPAVKLAIEGRDKYGWYPVSSLRFE